MTGTITKRDVRFYEMAERLALSSDCTSKHGAIVVRNGKPVALAANRKRTHPHTRQHKEFSTSIHAEQRCLVLAQTNVRGATLYSARANGERLGKPCAMCNELMIDAGISNVVYFDGNKLVKERVHEYV